MYLYLKTRSFRELGFDVRSSISLMITCHILYPSDNFILFMLILAVPWIQYSESGASLDVHQNVVLI